MKGAEMRFEDIIFGIGIMLLVIGSALQSYWG